MLTRFIRHFLLAIQFFTRIPVTGRLADWVGYSPAMLRNSAAHFPGVGWVVGGLTALVFAAVLAALPAQAASVWVAAVFSTVFSVLLTGAFHEDGLADTADGLGGGLTRERALEIMKDSRIGTYGSIALVLALTSKLGLLVLLNQVNTAWPVAALFAAHVTSRLAPLFLIRAMVHVGDTPHSKSKPLAESIGNSGVLAGLVWWSAAMALTAFLVPTLPILAGSIGATLGMAFMAWRLHVSLQGFTGDGLGATQQLSEIGFYLGLALAAGAP
jgi:adenosylcobinamide-GDP ribazoletransferase